MASKILKKRYAIQKQLSNNAGRRTLLARDLQSQELVVIKLLIFGEDFQWDSLKLFEREAQTLQLLSHPAIPCYLDYFDVDTSIGKGFALVQTYIPAKSLEQWLKAGRTFSEAEVKQLAQALLEILRYLHGQHPPVIHRDIKPSNILLANKSGNSVGQVYLVDFGSVQTLAAKKGSTITVVGTYGYMPPEQFGGRTVPASDIYSLGATLIYLVTGRHPAELPQDNLRIQFESSVNLNSDLIEWLKWMTQPSLNRRLASAGEAVKALEYPRQKTDIFTSVEKPFGSRIKVKKHRETVEIMIPPRRLNFWITFWTSIVMLIVFMVFLIPTFLSIKSLIAGDFLAILNLLFWSIPTGFVSLFVIGIFLINIFRSIRLELNPKQISLTYQWFWCKWQKVPILKKDISKLIHVQRSLITTKDSKGNSSTSLTVPKIIILTEQLKTSSAIKLQPQWYKDYRLLFNGNVYKYELSADTGQLTDPEIDWLAHELSAWSGIPITVEHAHQEQTRRVEELKQALIARKKASP